MKYCEKCGSEIVEGSLFCKGCGSQVQQVNNVVNNNMGVQQPINNSGVQQPINNQFVQPNQVVNNQAMQSNQSAFDTTVQANNDEELIKAYIGKNADKIMNQKGGSIWCFFGGSAYFVYRKMYLFGLIWLMCDIVLSSKLSWWLNIILAFLFKKIYLSHVKRNVDKIKKQYINSSFDELKSICSQKGGTNTLAAIILVGIIVIFKMVLISKGA